MNIRSLKYLPLCLAVTLAGIVMPATSAKAAVWETTQSWTPEWEAQYRAWVKANWDKKYFTQPGPLQGILFDCADTVYTMRVLFASMKGLPFAIKDPTTSAGTVISNELTRFDSKAPDQRLRSFVKLIMSVGSTASLPNDTYPVAISQSTLDSGSLLLTDRKSHHSWTIKHFSPTGIPYLVFGSRPARTELYERFEYPSQDFIFPNGIRPETHAGFRSFRYPEDIGKKVYEVPGYSLQQYQIQGKWSRGVQKLMQQVEETAEERSLRLLKESCKGAFERVAIVRDAVIFNEQIGSRCMTATEYDDYSTPSRDGRLKATFQDLAESYREANSGRLLSAKTRAALEGVLSGSRTPATPDSYCLIEIAPGQKLTLGAVYEMSVGNKLSNNPHDTFAMRWGLARGPSAKASSCPVY